MRIKESFSRGTDALEMELSHIEAERGGWGGVMDVLDGVPRSCGSSFVVAGTSEILKAD